MSIKSLPLYWRRIPQRYRLEGTHCLNCNAVYFPARSFCRACRRKGKIEPKALSGEGKVYSHTTIYQAGEGFDLQVPYTVAIVELREGAMVLAQLADVEPEKVSIGMPVKMVVRKVSEDAHDGLIHYGYKFMPAEDV